MLFFKASLFHIYFAFTLEFFALQYLTPLKTTLIYSSTPFIAAILAYLILNERLTLIKVTGIIIGLAGILPVILAQASGVEATMEIFRISYPEVILFFAVISSSYAWFIIMDLMNKGYGLGLINGMAMLVGGLLSFVTAVLVEGISNPVTEWAPFLFWLSLLILSSNLIVYNLYAWLLKRYSIVFVTFSGFLSPGFGIIYQWLFLKGRVTWHYIVSLLLVTLGLYVFYQDELKRINKLASQENP